MQLGVNVHWAAAPVAVAAASSSADRRKTPIVQVRGLASSVADLGPRSRDGSRHGSSNVRDIKKIFSVLIDLLRISKIYISLISIARARAAARSAPAGHERGLGLRHAAPLGACPPGTLMRPAHQISDRRSPSDVLDQSRRSAAGLRLAASIPAAAANRNRQHAGRLQPTTCPG